MTRRRWTCLLLGATVLLAMGGGWRTRRSWLPWIVTFLNVSEPLKHAPCVLILPGSEETRPFVAAGLVKAGYADCVLIPETQRNSDVREGLIPATTEMTRQILIRRGIPDMKIVTLEGASDSTIGDAQALDRYFQQSGVTDVIVVTCAYHSRRARWAFRHVLPQHQDHVRFYTAPNGFETRAWWTSRSGRRAVLSELLKFAFYLMYYGHGWLWCLILTSVGGTILFTRRGASRCGAKGSENVGIHTTA